MPQPTTGQVHVDFALSNVSLAILQNPQNFIADRVFPRVPVQFQSNEYFKYPRGFFNRTEAQKRAPGAEAQEKGYDIETDTYSCSVYAIKHKIPDQVRANADSAITLDREGTQLITHDLLIQRDVLWGSTYFTTGVWGTDITGDASGSVGAGETVYWSDETNGKPITDMRDAITTVQGNTGIRPNTVVLSRDVFDVVIDHPDFTDRVVGAATTASPGVVNEQVLASLLGVDRVLVWNAVQNTATEGQTASHSFIGSKKCLITYAAPNPGLMIPTAGYSFSWQRYAGFDISVKRYRDEITASDILEAETSYDMKLVSSDLGYFFNDIIA